MGGTVRGAASMTERDIRAHIQGLHKQRCFAEFVLYLVRVGGTLRDVAEVLNANMGTRYPPHRVSEWLNGARPVPPKVLSFAAGYMED